MTELPWRMGDLLWLQIIQVSLLIPAVGLLTRWLCRDRPYPALALWTIVLPAAFVRDYGRRKLTPIVLHELIHIRRGDLWLALLSEFVRAVWWFHPLVRWALRRAEWESERCCDEAVVACMGHKAVRYAHSLIDAIEQSHRWQPISAVPGVRSADITSTRLERIMRLGHGSQRRMPVSCWLLAVLAAAVVLPGAAGTLAQPPLSRESATMQRDVARPAGSNSEPTATPHDQHVDQASCERPAGAQWAEVATAPSDLAVTVVYDVADLLEKLKHEQSWPADPSPEQLKEALVRHLSCHIHNVHKSSPPLAAARPAGAKQGAPKSQPQFAWYGERLVVAGTREQHERLADEIQCRRRLSFRQVRVEVRIIRGDANLATCATGDSAADSVAAEAGWRNRWILLPQEFANVEPEMTPPSSAVETHDPVATADTSDLSAIKVVSGTSDPIVYQFVSDSEFRSFFAEILSDRDATGVLAPKVTLFDGQSAEICDTSQRPFVTDHTKAVDDHREAYQPVIQVFWEGIRIQLMPVITADGYRLTCRFVSASINDCKMFRSPRYPDAKNLQIQHPIVSTNSLECTVDIPEGQMLLIGGLAPATVNREVERSLLGRILGREPGKITLNQVTYIAIRPHTVAP